MARPAAPLEALVSRRILSETTWMASVAEALGKLGMELENWRSSQHMAGNKKYIRNMAILHLLSGNTCEIYMKFYSL